MSLERTIQAGKRTDSELKNKFTKRTLVAHSDRAHNGIEKSTHKNKHRQTVTRRDPAICAMLEAMAIVWLMTPAIVAIGGFCAGLGFHVMSKFGREAVFVFLRYTLGNRMRYQPRKRTSLFMRPLTPSELPNYLEHLLRLDPADRRMRFGFPVGDTGIRAHVQRIDLRTGHILALFDDDLDVVAAAHIGRAGDDVAELALSVDREWRGRGVGSELFARAVLWARNRGIRQAIVYCLNENQRMRHIVRKAGGQMTVTAGEIEGRLELLPATPFSLLVERVSECLPWLSLSLTHRLLAYTSCADGRSGPKECAARRATVSAGP